MEVIREGGAGENAPLQVQLGEGGSAQTKTWMSGEGQGSVRFDIGVEEASDVRVVLDPRGRTVESDMGGDRDPRADNYTHKRWKFLVDGFRFGLNTVEGHLSVSLGAHLEREHDLHHKIIFEGYELPRNLGLATTWSYGFGKKVRPNLLEYAIALTLKVDYLKPLDEEPDGFGAALGVGFGHSSYRSRNNPMKGSTFGVSGGVLLNVIRW